MSKLFTILFLALPVMNAVAQPFPRPRPIPIPHPRTNMVINSPTEGSDLRLQTGINLSLSVASIVNSNVKIVVFRSNNGAWPRVQESPIAASTLGDLTRDVTPGLHFCEDLYAIRVMSGTQTLAGPVHFKAGTGACSGESSKFVNLENNLIDLLNFKPANQDDRDTCGAFASAAALSAAYRRLKGHNVLLSQHYLHHINKSSWYAPTPFYLYENQTAFWGGNSVPDTMKILSNYPIPNENYAPYQSQAQLRTLVSNLNLSLNWSGNPAVNRTTQEDVDKFEYSTSHIPLIARQTAAYGVTSYKVHNGAEAKDTTRIENYLKNGQEVILGVTVKWRAVANKAKSLTWDANARGGGHMMVIVGFDKTDSANPYFLIKNSWADGILRVHYDFIRNQPNPSIAVIDSVREPSLPHASRWLGAWEMKHDQWRGQLILRRATEANLGRVSGYLRLGEYHNANGKRHCVYGTWDPSTTKLMMKINFDQAIEDKEVSVTWEAGQPAVKVAAKTVCPEAASGQYFELNMATNTHKNAYGRAVWNNTDFPAEIWRE